MMIYFVCVCVCYCLRIIITLFICIGQPSRFQQAVAGLANQKRINYQSDVNMPLKRLKVIKTRFNKEKYEFLHFYQVFNFHFH